MTPALKTFSGTELKEIYAAKDYVLGMLSKSLVSTLKPKNPDSMVITGGCFASFLQGDVLKDIDIYYLELDPAEEASIKTAIMIHYRNFKMGKTEYFKNQHIKSVYTTDDGVPTPPQFMFTDYTNRQDLVASFDYKHCCASMQDGKLYITRTIYDAIKKKKLVVNNPEAISDYRLNKFIQRGYTIGDAIKTEQKEPLDPMTQKIIDTIETQKIIDSIKSYTQSKIQNVVDDLESATYSYMSDRDFKDQMLKSLNDPF
jgi:hypothetical protein